MRRGAECLARVFDQMPAMTVSDLLDGTDLTWATEDVNRQDSPGPRPRGRGDKIGIESQRRLIDVDKPGDGALVEQAIRGGTKLKGDVMTSSPSAIPKARIDMCSPAVPLLHATPNLRSTSAATAPRVLGEAAKGENIA